MIVKFGQDVAFSTLEKEFMDAKLEICESIYGRLKANLRLYIALFLTKLVSFLSFSL